jgi:hypothetical protein
VETASPKHPRLSKGVQRGFEVVLSTLWLGGTAFLLDVVHTGLWGPIVLLIGVVVAELLFVRWNDGHWPGDKTASESKPS